MEMFFWKAQNPAMSWYLISLVFQLDMMGQKIAYPNAVLNITALNEEIAGVSNEMDNLFCITMYIFKKT